MTLYLSGRVIEYTNQLIYETDFLRTNLYQMTGLSRLIQTILGTGINNSTLVVDLPCTPGSGLTVSVGAGSMYAYVPLDATPYGVLPANTTDYLLKQFINFDPVTLTVPVPIIPGNSAIHLVQAIWQTQDVNIVSRPYYNSDSTPTNPLPPIFESNADTRLDSVSIVLKPGVSGSSPTPPAPDPGYTALYYITVTQGQTSIISGDISVVPGAPFITESLTQKISSADIVGQFVKPSDLQKGTYLAFNDISLLANRLIINPNPAYPSYQSGMWVIVNPANNNTDSTTLNVNGMGTQSIVGTSGSPLAGGEIRANQPILLIYDGSNFLLLNPANVVIPSQTNNFSVYQNIPAVVSIIGIENGTNQSITITSLNQQITVFNTVIEDNFSIWDNSTSSFVVPFDGHWAISGTININSTNSNKCYVDVYKSNSQFRKLGTCYSTGNTSGSPSSNVSIQGYVIDSASAGDNYQFYYGADDGSSSEIGGNSNELYVQIQFLGT